MRWSTRSTPWGSPDVLELARELLAPQQLSVAGVGTEEELFSGSARALALAGSAPQVHVTEAGT